MRGYGRCIDCKILLSKVGKWYGAGDGTGELFRCPGCHWRNEFNRLHEAVMPIMRSRGRVELLPAGELAKSLVLALAKDVQRITEREYEEYC